VRIVELEGGESLTLPDGLELSALKVEHRIPCLAYRFTRTRAPKFDAERARALDIPITLWSKLQSGESVTDNDRTITSDQVLGPPRRGLTVGFVTDTRVTPDIPDFIRDADLLICEGTYGDPELRERAESRGHMVFDQAAAIAREANARQLILTHFSPAMLDPENYLHYAQEIFPASSLGRAHETITLPFQDD
jgi:ribonuclease Z